MQSLEHLDCIRMALRTNQWDLVVCALPKNVLLLSVYWPVVGMEVALASSDDRIALLVPEDEEELANCGWAAESIRALLQEVLKSFSDGKVRVALEAAETSEPASYAAMHLYHGQLRSLLAETVPNATLDSADKVLAILQAVKTDSEIARLHIAAEIAGRAFCADSGQIQVGETEVNTAAKFRQLLSTSLATHPELQRADCFVWCMSGQISLTLTVMGKPNDRQQQMYKAISLVRQQALRVIRPGAKGCEIDAAAREVWQAHGFGLHFKHSTGHGTGFSAIDANAKPRLHPQSDDRLEVGMVFHVEPAVYLDGYGGIRHCDMIAVTESGAELLTLFQRCTDDLVLNA